MEKIAVRAIVETVMKCGDIDSRYSDKSTMASGARAHRKIQKSMGENYKKEVALKCEVTIDGAPISVQGRADGIIEDADGSLTIDEIKTTTMPLEILYTQSDLHSAQAKCYAYMIMNERSSLEKITVQLTYYQLDTEELKRYTMSFSREEIIDFFEELIKKYTRFIRFKRQWMSTRDESISKIDFPYESYRKGQREMAVATYKTIRSGKNLYAQAPTGIGKTISCVFPSIKAIGEGECTKIFYLTAKTVTRTVAEDAAKLLEKNDLRFKTITLRAKDKICFTEEKICSPEHCEYAKGHFDRVNEAVFDVLENNDVITVDITEEYARKHMVCPHEFALDISLWTDMVIGDYNHVFDPVVYLHRFFAAETSTDYVFLIDEAHNMADRVRDMYSSTLDKSMFLGVKRLLKKRDAVTSRLKKSLDQINKFYIETKNNLLEEKVKFKTDKDINSAFIILLERFSFCAQEWLSDNKNQGDESFGDVLGLYLSVSRFLKIAEDYSLQDITITESNAKETSIELFCLDPSSRIRDRLMLSRAAILFSATLTPLEFYRSLLGGSEDDYMLDLPSPFNTENLMLLANTGVSTKYIDRESSYLPISEAIFESISGKKGNYMVYFPSYFYMDKVTEIFLNSYPQIKTLIQGRSMNESERADFLDNFKANPQETLVGFGVLGGIFSEGIDLTGDRLIGSVIVGVGLPMISKHQDEIKNYYNENGSNGFDYAYVYPGMNKVLQAAGRVIRTESDYGMVVLIDSRFSTQKYKKLFPLHWSEMKYIRNHMENSQHSKEFFKNKI